MPVLLMTGYASADDVPIGHIVLNKPFLPHALINAVRTLLER